MKPQHRRCSQKRYDRSQHENGFWLESSDSDFTRLASRLKETGKRVLVAREITRCLVHARDFADL
jgi:uncharacterized LabA/DUF88 family protein